jgi:hypothetical protein
MVANVYRSPFIAEFLFAVGEHETPLIETVRNLW